MGKAAVDDAGIALADALVGHDGLVYGVQCRKARPQESLLTHAGGEQRALDEAPVLRGRRVEREGRVAPARGEHARVLAMDGEQLLGAPAAREHVGVDGAARVVSGAELDDEREAAAAAARHELRHRGEGRLGRER